MSDAPAPPPSPDPGAPADPGRRKAVATITGVAGACLGCAVAAGPIGMALDPLLRADATPGEAGPDWTRVGDLARFPVGAPPVRVVLRADREDAWLTRPNVPLGSVLVERLAEADFRVFSAVCPHLGCAVGFRAADARYHCPCHGSAFERSGALVPEKADGTANPSPRGLDALDWRLEGGALFVAWARYELGTAEARRIG